MGIVSTITEVIMIIAILIFFWLSDNDEEGYNCLLVTVSL